MKMCLAPCYKGCTDERYAEEAAAVQDFLATRGESKLVQLRTERDAASADLAFEEAATLHAQVQKVEAVRALAPELVQPMSKLSAAILQASANPDEIAVFLFERGSLRGPVGFSTIGMRIQNEQSGSSSLFAQPMALEPVVEAVVSDQLSVISHGSSELRDSAPVKVPRTMLEARMEAVLEELMRPTEPPNAVVRQGHLALLKRWYYRPEVKREGEVCFPNEEGRWPVRSMLRSVGRVAAKTLAHPVRA
jgi:excinuclease UvrABC nuclease subunit